VEGRPDRVPGGERIFAGETSDAYLKRDAAARGYTLLFWRGRHASELTDLDPGELLSFTRELVAVCRDRHALPTSERQVRALRVLLRA
jgi:diadenosine tetraphosphate (Ap4A) HIT family hydrolase